MHTDELDPVHQSAEDRVHRLVGERIARPPDDDDIGILGGSGDRHTREVLAGRAVGEDERTAPRVMLLEVGGGRRDGRHDLVGIDLEPRTPERGRQVASCMRRGVRDQSERDTLGAERSHRFDRARHRLP